MSLAELVAARRDELGLSYREVEERAAKKGRPVNKETVRQVAIGKLTWVTDDSLRGLSAGLGIPLRQLTQAAGVRSLLGPWVPPPIAERLTLRQRRALERLIGTMVDPHGLGDQ